MRLELTLPDRQSGAFTDGDTPLVVEEGIEPSSSDYRSRALPLSYTTLVPALRFELSPVGSQPTNATNTPQPGFMGGDYEGIYAKLSASAHCSDAKRPLGNIILLVFVQFQHSVVLATLKEFGKPYNGGMTGNRTQDDDLARIICGPPLTPWCYHEDSNPEHPTYKDGALPVEL